MSEPMGYIVVDDCTTHRANCFTSEVYKTLEEAEREALNAWIGLTLHDKKERDEFYVAHVDIDDNIIDIPYRIK